MTGGDVFFGAGEAGVKRVVVAEIAFAGKPAPTIDVGCIHGGFLAARTISCGN